MIKDVLNLKYEERKAMYLIKQYSEENNTPNRNINDIVNIDDEERVISDEYYESKEPVLQGNNQREVIAATFSFHTAIPEYEKQLYSDTNFAGNEQYESMDSKFFYDQKHIASPLQRSSDFSKDSTLVFTREVGRLNYSDGNRNDFVAKIFAMLTFALLVTASIQIGILYSPLKEHFKGYTGMIVSITMGICMLTLHCMFTFIRCMRRSPLVILVFILMIFFTSFLCGVLVTRFNAKVIIYAFLATAVVFTMCFCLAFTSFDFTSFFYIISVVLMALTVTSVVIIIVHKASGDRLSKVGILILFLEVIFLCVLMTIELQMVLRSRRLKLYKDQWINGAYLLYSSIMDIFFKLSKLVNNLSEEDDD